VGSAKFVGAAVLTAFCAVAHAAACPDAVNIQLQLNASLICVFFEDAALNKEQPLLRTWINRSAHIVADYYGQFPAPLVVIRLRGTDGSGVNGGRTTSDGGLMIQMRVGRETTPETLAADWVMVHEMVHLALPEVGKTHDWLAEGLAT
jgi:hypothetical protein